MKFSDSSSYFVPFTGYTITNGADGKVHVVYDMANIYSVYFFDSDFSIRVAIKDSDVEIIYNVTWLEGEEPKASISSTLEDGKTYYGSIEFDITATDASGNSVDKDGVEVGLKFSDSSSYFNPFTGYTITNGADGKIHVVYDMANIYSIYFFDSDFSIRVAIKDSDVEIIYNVTWLEGEEPHAEFSATGITDGYEIGSDFEITVTAKDANGKAIPSSQIGFRMTLWAGKWVDVQATVKSESNGVIVFTISYSSVDDNYGMGMMDPFTFSIDQKDASGNIVESIQFSNVDLA